MAGSKQALTRVFASLASKENLPSHFKGEFFCHVFNVVVWRAVSVVQTVMY